MHPYPRECISAIVHNLLSVNSKCLMNLTLKEIPTNQGSHQNRVLNLSPIIRQNIIKQLTSLSHSYTLSYLIQIQPPHRSSSSLYLNRPIPLHNEHLTPYTINFPVPPTPSNIKKKVL